MILLFDVGNTHTHLGLANATRVVKQANIRTADWFRGRAAAQVGQFAARADLDGAAVCSVVPRATAFVTRAVRHRWDLAPLELTPTTLRGLGIDYPRPRSIGPDRLANALAARHH